MKRTNLLFLCAILFSFSRLSSADIQWLPESRHQQYMTYGFFTEEHSSFLWRHAGRAWGALGGSIAVAEADWKSHPQLVFFGSANSAFRFRPETLALLTETTDARVGIVVEMILSDDWRLSTGYTHFSGHISDNVPDAFLIGPNVGNESFRTRIVHDLGRDFRLGGTFRPFISSEPNIRFFAADQFAEWFPGPHSDDPRHLAPYLALGLEEYGSDRVQLSGNIQAGAYLGNHFLPKHMPSLRMAVGYYSGVDPRLKYAQYLFARSQFAYAGLFFDL